MKKKQVCLCLLSALLLCLGLCACDSGEESPVSVQSVAMVAGMGSVGLNDSYAGVVQAGQTVPVEKDERLRVKELLVAAGDRVTEGQTLFTYDTEAISLELDKLQLELEQMKASVTAKEKQIDELEKEKAKAKQDEQLSYTLQIQELEIDLTELGINIGGKEKEIDRMEAFLETDSVASPISGRIQAINENGGTDDMGNPLSFITILETEVYRVKGAINEQNAGALMPGTPVVIRSRMDDRTWTGAVEQVDWENPVQSGGGYWGYSDEMTQSSKYPFYVSLDSDEGLMLGQHVYIEPGTGASEGQELMLPAWCVNDADSDAPWVWAADPKQRLEKRSLELGDYAPELDAYPVLSGLALTDYIAPDGENCKPGAPVVYYSESDFRPSQQEGDFPEDFGETGFEENFFGGSEEDFFGGSEDEGAYPLDGEFGVWSQDGPAEIPSEG